MVSSKAIQHQKPWLLLKRPQLASSEALGDSQSPALCQLLPEAILRFGATSTGRKHYQQTNCQRSRSVCRRPTVPSWRSL